MSVFDRLSRQPLLGDALWGTEVMARRGVDALRAARARLDSEQTSRRKQERALRAEAILTFADASKEIEGTTVIGPGQVTLVDGIWDNVGHWFRYGILRAALGLSEGQEILVTHQYGLNEVRSAARTFGFSGETSLRPTFAEFMRARSLAASAIAEIKEPKDVIEREWPFGWPGGFVYDELQRKQKRAVLDIHDRRFRRDIISLYASFAAAERVLDQYPVGLVVLSHLFPFSQAALARVAMTRGIAVVLLFSSLGTLSAIRVRYLDDLYRYTNLPEPADVEDLTDDRISQLRQAGRDYLSFRLAGQAPDLGSEFAYRSSENRTNREALCTQFGWPVERPIIAIYAMNWFDTPHAHGMSRFRDARDWMLLTIGAAALNTQASWLLKPHPAEAWYGGDTLSDVVPADLPDHMRVVNPGLNNTDMIGIADGVVTVHGTAGLEFSALGKPALLAEPGWYGGFGVGILAHSREDFCERLSGPWWLGFDAEHSRAQAELVAGLCYCVPHWQKGFVANHDTYQDSAAPHLSHLVIENKAALRRERVEIRDWFESGTPAYQAFKVLRASRLILPYLKGKKAK